MNNNPTDRKFLRYLTECTSTNDCMKELVQAESAREGMTLYTDHQMAGKGQHGRDWYDVQGRSLALSILLRPARLSFYSQFMLNKLIASAVHQSLADFADRLTIKWPNDLMHKDRKVGGILIENSWKGKRWEHAVVGIGVNVNGMGYPLFRPEATSLKMLTGRRRDFDITMLAETIAVNVLNWYRNKRIDEVEGYYQEHLYAKGIYRRFKINDQYFTAAIKGVTADGRLELFESDGTVAAFTHGDIQWIFD